MSCTGRHSLWLLSRLRCGSCVPATGALPEAWGAPGALPQLRVLAAKGNAIAGSLPDAWGNATGALPSLAILNLDSNRLWGQLPAAWAKAWPNLS